MRVDLYPKGGMSGYWEEMEGGGGGRTSLGKKLILSDTAILEILERF